jgi:hypothetical protein
MPQQDTAPLINDSWLQTCRRKAGTHKAAQQLSAETCRRPQSNSQYRKSGGQAVCKAQSRGAWPLPLIALRALSPAWLGSPGRPRWGCSWQSAHQEPPRQPGPPRHSSGGSGAGHSSACRRGRGPLVYQTLFQCAAPRLCRRCPRPVVAVAYLVPHVGLRAEGEALLHVGERAVHGGAQPSHGLPLAAQLLVQHLRLQNVHLQPHTATLDSHAQRTTRPRRQAKASKAAPRRPGAQAPDHRSFHSVQ